MVMIIRCIILLALLVSSHATSLGRLSSSSWMTQTRGGADSVADESIIRDKSSYMPSLFGPEDAQYDRYAACLAATEGLRKIRDKLINKKSKKFSKKEEETEDEKRASAQYVVNSEKILQALGMSVGQFNQLGRQVNQDENLKEKVMEQAFLYRVAATMEMDRIPIIEDPASEKLLKATRRQRVQMFCESIQEIETLRSEQMAKLTRSLHVEKLPEGVNLSDPAVMPFLKPKVRAVIEAFPFQAEEIVKKHGLHSEEFNKMLQEAKSNPIFRWRVEQYMQEEAAEE